MLDDPQLDPREREALTAVVNAIATRRRQGDFIQPVGSPANTRLGLSAVLGGGVEAIAPDGRRHMLVPGLAPWIWPSIVGGVGVFIELTLAFALRNEPVIVLLLLLGFMFVLFGAITLGTYVAGRRHARHRLVFDAPARVCREFRGAQPVLCVPAKLMRATRIQVQATAGYADVFNVLVDLGFAELWIHQTDEPTARQLAGTIAQYMGIPFDPRLERRPGD